MTLSIAAPRHTDTLGPCGHALCAPHGGLCLTDGRQYPRHDADRPHVPAPMAAPGMAHCLCVSDDERFLCTAASGHPDDHAAHYNDGRVYASWHRTTPRPSDPVSAFDAECRLRGLDPTEQRARNAADAALATVPTHAPTTERERVWRDTYAAHLAPEPAGADRWTTDDEPQPREATDADRWAAIRLANGHPFATDPDAWRQSYDRALSARLHHLT